MKARLASHSLGRDASMMARLQSAQAHCLQRGLRLTPLRQAVFEELLAANGPLKAYDLLTRFQAREPGTAPMTIYRALDFLIEAGLIHKIAATASFVVCTHDGEHEHAEAAFLVCQRCGRVEEVLACKMIQALHHSASAPKGKGFRTHSIEVHGLCADCQQA